MYCDVIALSEAMMYRKVPIVTSPESNVNFLWLLVNPESSAPPETNDPSLLLPKVARPSFFKNCIPYTFNLSIDSQNTVICSR